MGKTGKKPVSPTQADAPRVHTAHTSEPSGAIDVATLDATRDGEQPDAGVDVLCVHAEALATQVRLHEERLKLAKIAPGTADRLEALTQLLRTQQTAWTRARSAVSSEDLATARSEAGEARGDLFAALRFFTQDRPKVQRALDGVAEGDGDPDTLQDIHTLLDLANDNADALQGTDMPPEKVAGVREKGERFRTLLARAQAKRDEGAEEGAASQGALSKEARAALGLRNRVFWALSSLDRHACACGKYAFRKEPAVATLFGAYVQRTPKKTPPAT